MSVEIIQRRPNVIHIRVLAHTRQDEPLALWQTIQQLTYSSQTKTVLLEFNGDISFLEPKLDPYEHAQHIKALSLDPELRVAIICKNPKSLETLRHLIRSIKTHTKHKVKVFSEEDFAKDWLYAQELNHPEPS